MRTLVVAAHPDDEVLGAGGTIAKLAAGGTDITIFIAAEGISMRHTGVTLETALDSCQRAARRLGVTGVRFGGFSHGDVLLADEPQRLVVGMIERIIAEVEPEVVLTHHPGDIHADHRAVAHAVTYATRLLGHGPVRRVMHFEVLSSTEQQVGLAVPFQPTVFSDISGFVDTKCDAMSAYRYEVFEGAHPRSLEGIRALARLRGLQAGVADAEAFVLGRELLTRDGGGGR